MTVPKTLTIDQERMMDAATANMPTAPHSLLDSIASHRGLMDVKDVAKIFGVARPTVYEWVSKRQIPHIVIPGAEFKRFDPATLIRWLLKYNPEMDDSVATRRK